MGLVSCDGKEPIKHTFAPPLRPLTTYEEAARDVYERGLAISVRQTRTLFDETPWTERERDSASALKELEAASTAFADAPPPAAVGVRHPQLRSAAERIVQQAHRLVQACEESDEAACHQVLYDLASSLDGFAAELRAFGLFKFQ
jgi:hypothetical protein